MTFEATDGGIRKLYVDSDIGQLHVRYAAPVEANRRHRPVILFGASPASGEAYNDLLLALGTDRLVLAFDNPGAGESAPPTEPCEHPCQLAALFSAALLALGLTKVDSYGHHSGAMLALALAAYHPDQVAWVTVSAVPYIADADRRTALRARYPTLKTAEQFESLQAQHLNKILKRPPTLGFDRAVELYVDALSAGTRMNWLIRASYADGAEAWIPRITAPVLYLQTANTLLDATLDAAALTRDATIRNRPDLDHFALWTHASDLAAELRAAFDVLP